MFPLGYFARGYFAITYFPPRFFVYTIPVEVTITTSGEIILSGIGRI